MVATITETAYSSPNDQACFSGSEPNVIARSHVTAGPERNCGLGYWDVGQLQRRAMIEPADEGRSDPPGTMSLFRFPGG